MFEQLFPQRPAAPVFERDAFREGDVGIENGVVDKKGAWLQFEGELIGQGKDAAQKAMVEKPALAKKIVDAILAKRAIAPIVG